MNARTVPREPEPWPERIGRLVDSRPFRGGVLAVIILAAVLVGVETYPAAVERHGGALRTLDRVVVGLFVVEALLKMARHGRRFHRYFLDLWNVFDFVIVVVCVLPLHAQYAAVLRLARVLRTLRLITALPRLQLIVGTLIRSVPAIAYIVFLLLLLFYVYAVLGVFLWRDNDPVHFGDLPSAMLTLFSVVTLEGWVDLMYTQMRGSEAMGLVNTTALPMRPSAQPVLGAIYFVSFVLLGTMVMLNLFIGVIVNSMEETRAERTREKAEQSGEAAWEQELAELEQAAADLNRRIAELRRRRW